jgi:Ca2+-binding RTX toxin-like protein
VDAKSRGRTLFHLVICVALVALTIFVESSPADAEDADQAPGEQPAVAAPALRQSASGPEGLQVVADERGRLAHSADAAGSTGSTSQVIPVKPPAATLRRATMFVASTGFSGPAQGAVLLDGVDVPLVDGVASSIASTNYHADVTDMVRAKVDGAAPGPIAFDVTETVSSSIDGVILSLIFDDPAVTTNRSVTLLFGAMQTSGDRFVLRMSEPLAPDSSDSKLEMSLGISFGYQSGATGQYSTVDVNGRRLTTSAGGEDDGESANGALITVGGVGDDDANPPDPNRIPDVPTYDDELYDLEPFVDNGDTSIIVETSNPSNDDNVFFAAFTTNPPVTSVTVPSDCPGFEDDPRPQIVGTPDSDTLTGTSAAEVICGLTGNDTIRGGGGDDLVTGDAGNDVIRAQAGADTVMAGPGVDYVEGNDGPDMLSGGRDNDQLRGGNGDDTLRGGHGFDILAGEQGADAMDGGSERDKCLTDGSDPAPVSCP